MVRTEPIVSGEIATRLLRVIALATDLERWFRHSSRDNIAKMDE